MKRLSGLCVVFFLLTACGQGSAPNPTSTFNREQTARLAGTWRFTSTFDDATFKAVYTLTDVERNTCDSSEYDIWGVDETGEPIIAGYYPAGKRFTLLDILFDAKPLTENWYSFNFDTEDSVSGCHYHGLLEEYTLGTCYPMKGIRVEAPDKGRAALPASPRTSSLAALSRAHPGLKHLLERQLELRSP